MSQPQKYLGVAPTQSSAGGTPVVQPNENNKKEHAEEKYNQSAEEDDQPTDNLIMETDEDVYEEDGYLGGLLGFFKSTARSDWLKPFQSTRFREPPPASWDSGFEKEIKDKRSETDSDTNIQEDVDSVELEKIEIVGSEDSDDGSPETNGEYGAKKKRNGIAGNEAKSRVGTQKPSIPFKSNARPKVQVKVVTKTENRKQFSNDVKSAANQVAKPTEKAWVPMQLTEKDLFEIFNNKLSKITTKPKKLDEPCNNKKTLANSCDENKCLQMKLPLEPQERIRQLTHHPGLQLSDLQHEVLQKMASKVSKRYDVILLTTASSNHFLESQALLQNLHKNVFPVLKNFTLLFYDIGLTSEERAQMEKYCQCQVLSFPFDKLPRYVGNLKCYAWKPLMIKAHIRQADVVLWLDASIRFNDDINQLQELVRRVKERGVQIGSSSSDTTFRSFRSLFHYFGDEPCMYLGMGQAKATIGGYHNEPFVERVILEPWVACGLHQGCMCPTNNLSAGCADSKRMAENYFRRKGPIIYGLCHRFDQSTITLILHKLYQANYSWVMMNVHEYGDIHRDHQVEYFKSQR